MHAVARLALHPRDRQHPDLVGQDGARTASRRCLRAGANDLGGTLMNESITRAAGAVHGQEMPPAAMEALIRRSGASRAQRTTLYDDGAGRAPRRLVCRRAARRVGQHPGAPLGAATRARRGRRLNPRRLRPADRNEPAGNFPW